MKLFIALITAFLVLLVLFVSKNTVIDAFIEAVPVPKFEASGRPGNKNDTLATQQAALDAVRPKIHWRAGDQLTYDYKLTFDIGLPKQYRREDKATLAAIQCLYHCRILSVTSDKVVMALGLSEVSYKGNEQPMRHQQHLLGSVGCVVEMKPNGLWQTVSINHSIAPEDRTLLMNALAVQAVLPERGSPASWDVVEEDGDGGRWTCRYAVVMGDASAVSKTRTAVALPSSIQSMLVTKSAGSITLGEHSIEAYTMDESMAAVTKDAPSLTSSLRLTKKDGALLPAWMSNLPLSGKVPDGFYGLAEATVLDENEAAAQKDNVDHFRRLLASVPFSASLQKLVEAVAKATDHKETIPAMAEMVSSLRAYPDRVFELLAALQTRDGEEGVNEHVSARLANVLSNTADLKESRDALTYILEHPDEFSPVIVHQAADATDRIKAPDSRVIGGLATLFNQVRDPDTQNIALQSMAVMAKNKGSAAAIELRGTLEASLAPAISAPSSLEEFKQATSAFVTAEIFSNGVADRYLQAVQSPDDGIRLETYRYLAPAAKSTGRADLLEALQNGQSDPSPQARSEALRLLETIQAPSSQSISPGAAE